MKKLICLLICTLLMNHSDFAQGSNVFQKQWQKADTLLEQNLPKSAIKEASGILRKAELKNDVPNILKAQLFMLNASEGFTEDFFSQAISESKQHVATTTGLAQAVWQSVLANYYLRYYQQNRYQILGRTAVAGNASTDFKTWDASLFFKTISELYWASLAPAKALQATPANDFSPLLLKGEHSAYLKLTMYDILANAALDFFQSREWGITQPENQFELSDEKGFLPPVSFVKEDFSTSDSNSLSLQAIRIYQKLTVFYLSRTDNYEGLVDVSLRRLLYVYSTSTAPYKDDYFFNGMESLSSMVDRAPKATSEVWYQVAAFLYQSDHYPVNFRYTDFVPGYKGAGFDEVVHPKRDLPFLKQLLKNIIQKFPEAKGAADAHSLLNDIDKQTLQLTTEQVYLPGEPMKALLNYQNADKVYFRLYRTNSNFPPEKNFDERNYTGKLLSNGKPIDQWGIGLTGSEDMEAHSTEFKMDALPYGNYYLLSCLDNQFNDDSNSYVVYTHFQVSNLSLVSENGNKEQTHAFVLNRKTGQPIRDVAVSFWLNRYNDRQKSYQWDAIFDTKSTEEGEIDDWGRTPVKNYYDLNVLLVNGQDSLMVGNFYNRNNAVQEPKGNSTRTFFFTDRSIYRPGQTIYFKGISVNHKNGTSVNQVEANQPTSVTFYDVNGQKIASQNLTTNAFGSFSGSFIAPETGLTGSMSISNEYGSVNLSVEEYKRPKFQVIFDALKGDFSLYQKVKIKGFAKAYAGNNIDGATVKYTVKRNARFPYFWAFYRWGQPSSPEMEITHGVTKTSADGSFEIEFIAYPDKSIDPESLPVFNFEVSADVTDQNGETRSGSQVVTAGYRSLQIIASVPDQGLVSDFDTIGLTTKNLNGVFVPATIEMSVHKLQFPGKIYRKRLWQKPDEPVLSEAAFRKYFPDDEYGNESDYHYWKPGQELFSKKIITTPGGKVVLPENIWKEGGWYVFEWKGKDANGKEVEQKAYAYVVVPQKSKIAESPIVVVSNKQIFEPGEEAKLWLSTGFENVHLLSSTSIAGDYAHTSWLHHTVEAQDRGGFGFSWFFIYNNRKYELSKMINVPWTNRDLEIEWGTHRDKLLPGADETWNLTIKGNNKEKVAAELLAGMYDASLDAFKPHRWRWEKMLPMYDLNTNWHGYAIGETGIDGIYHQPVPEKYFSFYHTYPKFDFFIGVGDNFRYRQGGDYAYYAEVRMLKSNSTPLAAPPLISPTVKFTPPVIKEDSELEINPNAGNTLNKEPEIQIRKNLQETAFFFPQLKTDENGAITFSFTMPEALTKWKFMAFAHTKDWKTGYLEGFVKTQKELMVQPNLPRFLRQGDDIILSSKVVNLSDRTLNGKATLEILNALTNQPMDLPFRLQEKEQGFSVEKERSTVVSWHIHVPESVYQPVIIRIVAKAGNFSDGEDNPMPVLSNRMLVTETLPLPIKGTGEHYFKFEDLLKSQTGEAAKSLVNHNLTVEFTGNPAWYAIQALPYLMEYPFECSEQTFSRFYANALAAHIIQLSPKVEQVFKQWQRDDTTALLSNLEKNQELKTVLLNETPWVLEAKSETEQKHRIALLFENYKISKGLRQNLQKLSDMQLPDGAFPWFVGMRGNRYITQYILAGLGRLQHLEVKEASSKQAQDIIRKGLLYLDAAIQEDYENLLKHKANLKKQQIGNTQIQYLYLRSFYLNKFPVPEANQKAFDFYKEQATQYYTEFNPYMKALLALALNRMNDSRIAEQIIAGLKETAVHNDELGMYWKSMSGGYYWYQAPIEAQSMLITAFSEIGNHPNEIAGMKTWLLKNKQTSNWKTTTATADAIYALLLKGGDWLAYQPNISIQLGNQLLDLSKEKTQAGTGYFKESFDRTEIQPDMGNIKVIVSNPVQSQGVPVSWGAVYWQYFQDMDKIDTSTGSLQIKKELFIENNTAAGSQLVPVTDGNTLKVGSKVKVRIILKADRDMDYVHLKDMRAATFEPVDVLSGYRYQNGLGYYQSTLDASTNFFFDYLPKGTYVLEYEVFVGQKGDFSNGISTVQCMYAPEFSSHSEGLKVKVR